MLAINQPIEPGDSGTAQLGFTVDNFEYGSYLWALPGVLTVSMVISKHPGQGHFSALVRKAEAAGFAVKVPTPLGKMPAILKHLGFQQNWEDTDMGPCEMWSRRHNLTTQGTHPETQRGSGFEGKIGARGTRSIGSDSTPQEAMDGDPR